MSPGFESLNVSSRWSVKWLMAKVLLIYYWGIPLVGNPHDIMCRKNAKTWRKAPKHVHFSNLPARWWWFFGRPCVPRSVSTNLWLQYCLTQNLAPLLSRVWLEELRIWRQRQHRNQGMGPKVLVRGAWMALSLPETEILGGSCWKWS